jgi:hypothetical protein
MQECIGIAMSDELGQIGKENHRGYNCHNVLEVAADSFRSHARRAQGALSGICASLSERSL